MPLLLLLHLRLRRMLLEKREAGRGTVEVRALSHSSAQREWNAADSSSVRVLDDPAFSSISTFWYASEELKVAVSV